MVQLILTWQPSSERKWKEHWKKKLLMVLRKGSRVFEELQRLKPGDAKNCLVLCRLLYSTIYEFYYEHNVHYTLIHNYIHNNIHNRHNNINNIVIHTYVHIMNILMVLYTLLWTYNYPVFNFTQNYYCNVKSLLY